MGNIFCTPKSQSNQSSDNRQQNNQSFVAIKSQPHNNDALSKVSDSAISSKGTPFPAIGISRSGSDTNITAGVIQKDRDYKTTGILKKTDTPIPINESYRFFPDNKSNTKNIPMGRRIVDSGVVKASIQKNRIKKLTKLHQDINRLSIQNGNMAEALCLITPGLRGILCEHKGDEQKQLEYIHSALDFIIIEQGNTHRHYDFAVTFQDKLDHCEALKEKYNSIEKDWAKTQKAT